MIPDPKTCNISNKTKNVYIGEPNIPDTTSSAIIDIIDQDLDEDESENGALQDNDYAYASVPDPQAKSDHDSSAEHSDLKVKEEILSADIQSQCSSNITNNEKIQTYGERVIDDSGYLMPNVNKTYIEDQNTARSYAIQANSKASELGYRERFGEGGNESHVIDEADVLRLRPRPQLTKMPSSGSTERKLGIIEHTYFGVRDLLSDSSSQSSVAEDLTDNAVDAINSEAECAVPMLQGEHESLQHTYLDTRDLQEQLRSATLSFADQSNIFSVSKINEKEEGGDNPAVTVAVNMNGQGHVRTPPFSSDRYYVF